MGSKQEPQILLFGAGSLGTIYLYLLSKVASVTAVCRSNFDIVKKDGFIINSSIFGNNLHFRPNVVKTCEEAVSSNGKPFDFLLVCSKAFPGTIPDIIKPAVTPGCTTIVLLQNGIGIEEEYAEAFPTNPIVSCVAYLPATQRPAGIITHGEIELLEVGRYPVSAQHNRAQEFVDLVSAAGGTAEHHDDIQWKRWYKLLINASWNPICALTLCTDADFMVSSELATEMVRDVMFEVADIARTYHHEISKAQIDFQMDRAIARIANKNGVEPSMMQDVKAGRRIEVEAIVGNTVRLAKEKGVKCPKLEMIYILAKALDLHIGRERKEI